MKTRLAIYDLDRTLVRLPTWTPFLLMAVLTRSPWRLTLAPLALAAAAAYRLGMLDRRSLKQIMHRLALGPLTAAEADALADRFVLRFSRHISSAARSRIEHDRQDGFRIVIATAAYDFYAAALARCLGADALVATKARRRPDGVVLPFVEGDNCYGPAKLAMIREWMRTTGIDRDEAIVRFYSDHVSDLPVFEWADEPYAVNPHAALRTVATKLGWPQLSWS